MKSGQHHQDKDVEGRKERKAGGRRLDMGTYDKKRRKLTGEALGPGGDGGGRGG